MDRIPQLETFRSSGAFDGQRGYANDFFDTGNNDSFHLPPNPDPNYAATAGWDPVTGLGTPNAVNLVPDLIKAVHGL